MKTLKLIALMLALLLSISLTGCENAENTSNISADRNGSSEQKGYITLLYSAADGFNPYTVKTEINRQLCSLLYEPLIKLDNEFNAVYSIAESVENAGTKCVIKIRDVLFSDGTVLTADDVIYSCNLAKNSGSAFGAKLYEIISVKASNSKTIEFTLSKTDPYFINLLTFPIIKSGSEAVTDSDSILQPPIGSGRYKVDTAKEILVENSHHRSTEGTIKEIKLINAPDSESVSHYAEVGAADMYYSEISTGDIVRMSGEKININLNNLVYIGINQNFPPLEQNALRHAISTGIDRSKICRDAFYNNAVAATGFFNPSWSAVKAVQNLQIEANKKITVENLEKIGYNNLDSNGILKNKNGSSLRFNMLVNSENRRRVAAAKLIAEQLSVCGIKINVVEKSYAEYTASLASGNFQLFLGEVKMTENMDFSALAVDSGALAYGIKANTGYTADNPSEIVDPNPSGTVIKGFYEGKNSVTDIAVVLQNEMPFIPVCYRTGVLFYNEKIENVKNSSATDIYFSIESYKIKN